MIETTILVLIAIFAIVIVISAIRVVPQRSAYIVERLGKYSQTLHAGLHFLIPYVDKVSYIHTLKEQSIDVASQICITKDNISVEVDGILYLQVIDPKMASYGIDNYIFASTQLAQTTMRSIIGKLDLDKTFEEREYINVTIVDAVDKASDPWGVKVTRYEVKNISPPESIHNAMEKQMRAEREKRAIIATSEGKRQEAINISEGERIELIRKSEGEKEKRINEAEGRAQEIERIAKATAKGITEVANAIGSNHGIEAINLRIAEQYISEFGKLASKNNTMIIPSNLADIGSLIAAATSIVKSENSNSQIQDK